MTTFNELIYGGTKGQPEPEVGMGATELMWTDRMPYTIVDVVLFKSGPKKGLVRQITLQPDNAVRVDSNGMSDSQTYEFSRNTDAPTVVATRRKDDAFRTSGGRRFRVGSRDKYHDFSF